MNDDEWRSGMSDIMAILGEIKTEVAVTHDRLQANTDTTQELADMIRGKNGLMTRVSLLERSGKWLTWGVRLIVAGIVGGFLWFVRQ